MQVAKQQYVIKLAYHLTYILHITISFASFNFADKSICLRDHNRSYNSISLQYHSYQDYNILWQ